MPVDVGDDAFVEVRVFLHPDARVSVEARGVALLLDVAETLADREVLLGRQFLIAKEQHLVADPCAVEFLEQVVVGDGISDLHAGDAGGERAGHRSGGEALVCLRLERGEVLQIQFHRPAPIGHPLHLSHCRTRAERPATFPTAS